MVTASRKRRDAFLQSAVFLAQLVQARQQRRNIEVLGLFHEELTASFPLPLEQLLQRLWERGRLAHSATVGGGRPNPGGGAGQAEGGGAASLGLSLAGQRWIHQRCGWPAILLGRTSSL